MNKPSEGAMRVADEFFSRAPEYRTKEYLARDIDHHTSTVLNQREQEALNVDLGVFGTAVSLNGQHVPLEQFFKSPLGELIAERDRIRSLLSDAYGILEEVAISDSGHPEQDAFEREVFENIKKELGR